MGNDGPSKKCKRRPMLDEDSFTQDYIRRTKQAREESGYSPEEMADFLNLKFDTYLKYEYRTPLPRYLVPRFCSLCRVAVGWLFGVEEAARGSPFRRGQGAA
jgi:transcriptional regulator with XRE-family HTH domain